MNKSTLSALVVALMLGSGIAGYLIGKPGDSVDRAPPPTRTATVPAPQAAPQAPAAQRPAVITLPGKGFILPRGTAAGLPITTVNVSKLALSVYRVNERGLDKFVERYYYGAFPGSEPSTEMYALRQWLNGDNGKRIWR